MIIQPSHSHCTISVWPLYRAHRSAVQFPFAICRLHGYCTGITRFPYDLRTACMVLPSLSPSHKKVHNTHIQCEHKCLKKYRKLWTHLLHSARSKSELGTSTLWYILFCSLMKLRNFEITKERSGQKSENMT